MVTFQVELLLKVILTCIPGQHLSMMIDRFSICLHLNYGELNVDEKAG